MSDGTALPYGTPAAFDAALKDRLQAAANDGAYTVAELRRQFAYDRLLARAFTAHPDRWILKGGGGLLARIPGQARHSMDIDLFYRGEVDAAVSDLEDLGADDSFGDFFTFDISPNPGQFADGAIATNLSVPRSLARSSFNDSTSTWSSLGT